MKNVKEICSLIFFKIVPLIVGIIFGINGFFLMVTNKGINDQQIYGLLMLFFGIYILDTVVRETAYIVIKRKDKEDERKGN